MITPTTTNTPLSTIHCPAWHRLRFTATVRGAQQQQCNWRFCDCSDDSVFALAKLPLGDVLAGTDHAGMRDVIACPGGLFANLEPEGRRLVEQCADFLLVHHHSNNNNTYPKRVITEGMFHTNKYIALWSFIYDHLGIPKGYDYWLMNFLDWNHICEHGSGIRCAWWNDDDERNPLKDRVLSEEARATIVRWATEAADDV